MKFIFHLIRFTFGPKVFRCKILKKRVEIDASSLLEARDLVLEKNPGYEVSMCWPK